MNANDKLKEAAAIMEERGKTYDSPEGERSMGKAINAFNIITGHNLKESEGWLLMQILKDVRQWSRAEYHKDSADDCIAYSALKAEALEAEQQASIIEPVSDDSEWIEWKGGDCPVNGHYRVTVKLSNGIIIDSYPACALEWKWVDDFNRGNIIAYKVIKP